MLDDERMMLKALLLLMVDGLRYGNCLRQHRQLICPGQWCRCDV